MTTTMLLGEEVLAESILGVRSSDTPSLNGNAPEVELSLGTVKYFVELSLEGI